jgi:hypothetical protein
VYVYYTPPLIEQDKCEIPLFPVSHLTMYHISVPTLTKYNERNDTNCW